MSNKVCKSCCGPLDEFPKKDIKKEGFCPYCVDEKGELKSYGDILDGMIKYISAEHKEIADKDKLSTAQKWLSESQIWQKKFVRKDVVIEDVREQNIKDVPIMNKKKNYDCNVCMYYIQNDKKEKTAKNKREWFIKMNKEYGSCGKILYYKGEPVGFAQFAPKKEFIKLEDLQKGSTDTDAWYIACIVIKKNFQGKGLGKVLVNEVLEDLKKRGIRRVQVCGKRSGDASDFSSGYWSMYKEFGFKEIGGGKDYKVGEKKLNSR